MRPIENYTLESEHGEPLLLTYRDKNGKHSVSIQSGRSDDFYVFREGQVTYALSLNQKLHYVGMEAFRGKERIGQVFLDRDYEIKDFLGRKGLDLLPITIAKRIREICEVQA